MNAREDSPKKQRIGMLMGFLLIGAAFLADGMQLLVELMPGIGAVLGIFVSFLIFAVFTGWFKVLGVDYLDRNGAVKFIIWMLTFVFESIPFLNIVPATTLGVLALVLVIRQQDGKESFLFKVARFKKKNMSIARRAAAERRAENRWFEDTGSTAWAGVEEGKTKRDLKGDSRQALQKERPRYNYDTFSTERSRTEESR